jgi:hypothetical protein
MMFGISKNSKEIRARYVQLYNYEDMVKTGQIDPSKPGNTDYEKQIAYFRTSGRK